MKITKKFRENALLIVIGVGLFWALFNYRLLLKVLLAAMDILRPVILGAAIAFILNVPMSALERRVLKDPKSERGKRIMMRIRRPLAIIITLLLGAGVVALVLCLVIPALIDTVSQLTSNLPVLAENAEVLFRDNETVMKWLDKIDLTQADVIGKITDWLKDGVVIMKTLDSTVSIATALFSSLINFVLGMVFAVYMLAQKEKLKRQGKKIASAFISQGMIRHISKICRRTIDIFAKFLTGQTVEAVILGSLCCIGMTVFGFPNAVIVAVLVACTALIPIVGAFIGTGVGFLLICANGFKEAVLFVIFMLILQQIEGNFIYPKVVGGSVGLPALWTLFAVTVGGNLFGIAGMFAAVPVFSVIYCTLSEVVESRNNKRDHAEASA